MRREEKRRKQCWKGCQNSFSYGKNKRNNYNTWTNF